MYKILALLGLSLALSSCALSVETTPLTVSSPGTLTATKEDCKNEGWRNTQRHGGRVFKNQGQCVSFYASR